MLYHKSLGFPRWFRKPAGTLTLRYSRHAKKAARNDRYGAIRLPQVLDLSCGDVFEIETDRNTVVKYCVRVRYCNKFDLTIVVNSDGLVRTVWLNDRQDRHRTLNASRYATV